MSEMVERVAEAIYTAPISGDIDAPKWIDMREKYKDTYRDLARAAIEAMREPTERMIEKGVWSRTENGSYQPHEIAGAIYGAMIDEALK